MPQSPRPQTTDERFWSKVDKDGPIPTYRPDLGRCWIWGSTISVRGYGQFSVNGHTRAAYRVALELSGRDPLPRIDVDHLCRNKACVNPAHLEQVGHAENMRRAYITTEPVERRCGRGHLLEHPNLVRRGRDKWQCRACQNIRRRKGAKPQPVRQFIAKMIGGLLCAVDTDGKVWAHEAWGRAGSKAEYELARRRTLKRARRAFRKSSL